MFSRIARLFRNRTHDLVAMRASRHSRLRRSLRVESLEDRSLMASLVWSNTQPLPVAQADAAAVLGVDDSVYLLGGIATGGNLTPAQFQVAGSTSWGSAATIDKERVSPGAGALADGRIIIFGGQNGGESIEESRLYSPTNNNSNDGPSMSTERSHGAYATDPQTGLVYAFGGLNQDGLPQSSVEKYNPATNSWSPAASLPASAPNSYFAAASDGAGHIFVFGGGTSGSGSNQVNRYDVGTNSWTTMAPMPAALRGTTAVAGPNDGRIYVMGGRNASGPVATVYAYDFVSNTWALETNLPTAVTDAAAVLDSDGRILVLGGRNAAGTLLNTVQVSQDLDAVDSAPTFVSSPSTTATSTVLYSYQVVATGNPLPTFSLVSPPPGMTMNASGLISWTPNETHVGSRTVTIRATNRAGFVDQVYSIDVVSSLPLITSTPVTTGGTGTTYQYAVQATGSPAATFSLAAWPTGMTINPTTGLIGWTPTVSQVGNANVTVTATNFRGNHSQSFVISVADLAVPTTPASLVVETATLNSVSLGWNASSDNVGVAKYQILEQYKYGWRNSRTGYRLKQDNIIGTSTTIAGLDSGKGYKFVVVALDAAGNVSLRSNLVVATTLKLPTIYLYPSSQASVAATHEMFPIQVYGSGVPSPTLTLVSGPEGMTFNPATGVANYTPTDAHVGTQTAIFQATNSEGIATVTATITVRANLPVVSRTFTYFGTTWATPFAVEGDPFELQLYETFTNSPISWSIASGPIGMTIDPDLGTVSWIPTNADVGTASIVLRATNYAGSTDLPLSFDVLPLGTDLRAPTPVTGITVSVIDSTRASVTWAPSTDNVGVESYRITSSYRIRSGRFMRTVTRTFTAGPDATMLEMTGLVAHAQNLYIQAIDASGNVSPAGQVVSFTPFANPTFPSIGLSGQQPINVVVGQALQIPLTDANSTPRQFALLGAPPVGATIDATTGLISWTPTYEQVGIAAFTVRATNAFGYRDFTFSFPVAFTGAVSGVSYTNLGGGSATASWTPPTDTTHVAGYFVYQTWSISGHTYSHTYIVNSPTTTSLSGIYLVGGPVVHKVRVVAFDAFGNSGLSSPTVSLV